VSQENVATIVRTMNDAFRRGDWDAMAAAMDPDILVRTDPRWPEQRVYGRDAVMAFYRGAWESLGPDARIEELVDLGDRAIVHLCWFIRGQHSDAQGEMRYSELNTYRDGRLIFTEFFLERGQALKAVGLEE
jgi:ketosteroid isomerase-like protein